MARSLFILMLLLLVGCDYEHPLVSKASIEIDSDYVGVWQHIDATGQTNKLVVLPLNSTTYFIAYPASRDNTLYAKAKLWEKSGLRLVQLNWFGTANGKLAIDNRTYQYAHYQLVDDTLRVRLINPAVVLKTASSSAQLEKAILDNQQRADFYRGEILFTRLAQKESPAVQGKSSDQPR